MSVFWLILTFEHLLGGLIFKNLGHVLISIYFRSFKNHKNKKRYAIIFTSFNLVCVCLYFRGPILSNYVLLLVMLLMSIQGLLKKVNYINLYNTSTSTFQLLTTNHEQNYFIRKNYFV